MKLGVLPGVFPGVIPGVIRRLRERCVASLGVRRRRRLAWWLMTEAGVRSVVCERDGVVWNIRLDDDICWRLFVDGGFQVQEREALQGWMKRAGLLAGARNVVIDAGANIGTTCVPMALETGCRVLAIEPAEENFKHLRRNVEANGLSDRIALRRNAVARTARLLKMCLVGVTSGGHFVARDDETETPGYMVIEDEVVGSEEVEADTLTGIVAAAGLGLEEIALVWADVQGCELDVIESGSALWERGVPLWAEVEPRLLRFQGTLPVFARTAAAHFDRFIDARELVRLRAQAVPRPIAEFAGLIDGVEREVIVTDVLLLPPAYSQD